MLTLCLDEVGYQHLTASKKSTRKCCNILAVSFYVMLPGRVAQSVGHLTRKSGVLGSIPGLATYFVSPSAFLRRAVVSYWQKYVHKVLVNRLGCPSLPRKSVVRLSDRPDMTLDVYRGQQCNNNNYVMLQSK